MATSGVNVKMGVSGVAQFKQNINQAKQSLKTLDEQLKLNEKEFKASGDAQTYMETKAQLLNVKLEEQKAVLANAEKALEDMTNKGVDKASKAYQDMQRQVLQAKGAIIDTETAMTGVADAGEDAANGVDAMNSQLKRIGDGVGWQNVTGGLESIAQKAEKAVRSAVSLGKKLISLTLESGHWADDLHTRAQYFGLTDDELQRMEKTATLIDTPVEAIISAQKKLKKGLGSADKGVMGAFAALFGEGYNPNVRGWENAFWDIGEALMKFTDEEEKEVYAQKLFGRSWNELIPLFEEGRENYEAMNESWATVSDDNLEKLRAMDDKYQELKGDFETLKITALSQFAEPMAKVMGLINEKIAEFTKWLESDDGKAFTESVIGKIQEAIEWISDPKNIQTAIDALKAIAGGWVLIKLAGGAADILKLVNGISGLSGASAASAGATAGASWASSFASAAMKAAPFLAFLYTMLNPADTGNDDLEDENGNLTEVGAEVEKNFSKVEGRRYTPAQEEAAQELWDKYRTGTFGKGDLTEKSWLFGDEKWNELLNGMHELAQTDGWKELADLPEEFLNEGGIKQSSTEMTEAAGQLKGLPGVIETAILSGMAQVRVYIDGQTAGQVLTPYVGAGMGGMVMAMTK